MHSVSTTPTSELIILIHFSKSITRTLAFSHVKETADFYVSFATVFSQFAVYCAHQRRLAGRDEYAWMSDQHQGFPRYSLQYV